MYVSIKQAVVCLAVAMLALAIAKIFGGEWTTSYPKLLSFTISWGLLALTIVWAFRLVVLSLWCEYRPHWRNQGLIGLVLITLFVAGALAYRYTHAGLFDAIWWLPWGAILVVGLLGINAEGVLHDAREEVRFASKFPPSSPSPVLHEKSTGG